MKVTPAKENILKNIRKALTQSTPLPFPGSEGNQSVFQPSHQEPEIEFAEQFTRLAGKFFFCQGNEELVNELSKLVAFHQWTKVNCNEPKLKKSLMQIGYDNFHDVSVADCDVSITSCEALVARTGSIVLSPQNGGRTGSVYAPVHICIAYTNQLVFDLKDALQLVSKKYGNQMPSMISFATGPSRTADIEKTLVVGVHGPREVFCFLVEE